MLNVYYGESLFLRGFSDLLNGEIKSKTWRKKVRLCPICAL
jgi:hypothetical protein